MRRISMKPMNHDLLIGWVRSRSLKVNISLGVILIVMGVVLFLRLVATNYDHLFVASEAVHLAGITILACKLVTQKTCTGLSLKSQKLTALFLTSRLITDFLMEDEVHRALDAATLLATLWVIYMMRFKLKYSYAEDLDNFPLYYIVVPASILAFFVRPYTKYFPFYSALWAFYIYIESVSVLPQLRLIQNAKAIEPSTAHYVFALGMARFLACAHLIMKLIQHGGSSVYLRGSGYFWPLAMVLAEIVQTFLLADFCYYYVRSFIDGQPTMKMNSIV